MLTGVGLRGWIPSTMQRRGIPLLDIFEGAGSSGTRLRGSRGFFFDVESRRARRGNASMRSILGNGSLLVAAGVLCLLAQITDQHQQEPRHLQRHHAPKLCLGGSQGKREEGAVFRSLLRSIRAARSLGLRGGAVPEVGAASKSLFTVPTQHRGADRFFRRC